MYYGSMGLGATSAKAAWDQCKTAHVRYSAAVAALNAWSANEAAWRKYQSDLSKWQEAKRKYDEYVVAARGVGPQNASLSAHVAPLNRKAKEQNGLAPDAYPNDYCVSREIKSYAADRCESQTSIRGLGLTMFAMVSGKPPSRLYRDLSAAARPDCVIAAMPTCPTLVKAPAPVPNPGPAPTAPRKARYGKPSVPPKPSDCGPEPIMDGAAPPPPPLVAPPPPPPAPVRTTPVAPVVSDPVEEEEDEDSSNLAIYGVLALLVVAGGGYAYYRYRKVA